MLWDLGVQIYFENDSWLEQALDQMFVFVWN